MKVKYRNKNFVNVHGSPIIYVECDTELDSCVAVLANGTRHECPNVDMHFAERAVKDGTWTKDAEAQL